MHEFTLPMFLVLSFTFPEVSTEYSKISDAVLPVAIYFTTSCLSICLAGLVIKAFSK